MKTVIEMAKAAGLFTHKEVQPELERFAALVRADERNSWPFEMEAMERQVNILTDALAQERTSRSHSLDPGEMELSLRRNHKDELFECRRRFSAEEVMHGPDFMVEATASNLEVEMDRVIQKWSNT